jgi:hypothetical protein
VVDVGQSERRGSECGGGVSVAGPVGMDPVAHLEAARTDASVQSEGADHDASDVGP